MQIFLYILGDIVVSKSESTINGNADKDEKDEASSASDKEESSTDDERPGINGESNRSNGDVTAKKDDGFTEKEDKSQEENEELEEEDGNVDMAAGDENGKDEKEADEMEADEDDDDQNEIDDEEPEDNEDEIATSVRFSIYYFCYIEWVKRCDNEKLLLPIILLTCFLNAWNFVIPYNAFHFNRKMFQPCSRPGRYSSYVELSLPGKTLILCINSVFFLRITCSSQSVFIKSRLSFSCPIDNIDLWMFS